MSKFIGTFVICFLISFWANAQNVYELPQGQSTRWVNFENRKGNKGEAAIENKGGKGHAFERLPSGQSCTLLDKEGPGIINRIWLTVSDRSPEVLRSIRLDMYWDHEKEPAVSVPLGDFFCNGLSVLVPFENCYFSNPEGRSFNTCIPMPFRKAARIVLTNGSDKDLTHLFYDINLTLLEVWDPGMSYFHAVWNREKPTSLGVDYTVLDKVEGKGRFLGVSFGIQTDSLYKNTWWGEGEIKFYIDGDTDHPTLCGTGAEDYIGTAWGQGAYANWYQGSPIASQEEERWAFYRFHVPDPVFFYKNLKINLQQIGGGDFEHMLTLRKANVPFIPVTVDQVTEQAFIKLLDRNPPLDISDPTFPKGWVNYYRQDDVTSVAYFYLDRPSR